MATPHELSKNPIHLGLGATAVAQPVFTGGPSWYEAYGARHATDGAEGRLLAIHRFDESWDTWEMHPLGAEVVVCLEGKITLIQEIDGKEVRIQLEPHQSAINPPGVWHTAEVDAPATALFITAGMGTQLRPR